MGSFGAKIEYSIGKYDVWFFLESSNKRKYINQAIEVEWQDTLKLGIIVFFRFLYIKRIGMGSFWTKIEHSIAK